MLERFKRPEDKRDEEIFDLVTGPLWYGLVSVVKGSELFDVEVEDKEEDAGDDDDDDAEVLRSKLFNQEDIKKNKIKKSRNYYPIHKQFHFHQQKIK